MQLVYDWQSFSNDSSPVKWVLNERSFWIIISMILPLLSFPSKFKLELTHGVLGKRNMFPWSVFKRYYNLDQHEKLSEAKLQFCFSE